MLWCLKDTRCTLVIVGDAGKDSCPKKSKAESGSRLDIKSRQQGVASRSSVETLWFYGPLIDHVPKSVPLKLASLCTEAFPKRTLKECYFQGLYL